MLTVTQIETPVAKGITPLFIRVVEFLFFPEGFLVGFSLNGFNPATHPRGQVLQGDVLLLQKSTDSRELFFLHIEKKKAGQIAPGLVDPDLFAQPMVGLGNQGEEEHPEPNGKKPGQGTGPVAGEGAGSEAKGESRPVEQFFSHPKSNSSHPIK